MYIISKWFELSAELEAINAAAKECSALIQTLSHSQKLLAPLESLTNNIENSAVLTRNLLEKARGSANDCVPHCEEMDTTDTRPLDIAGNIEIIENEWIHMQLNTLLPHDRFKTPRYLVDTILRLMEELRGRMGRLPFYHNAFLVVDEHCDIASRTVYDNDNKQWRCIPNALKGKVFADDDQFHLGVALLTTEDETPSCHIYIMNAEDTADFFSLRAEGLV